MYFKEQDPTKKIVGVDCEGSIVKEFAETGKMGKAYSYVLEGVGEDFILRTMTSIKLIAGKWLEIKKVF